jgi:hypothetical protein
LGTGQARLHIGLVSLLIRLIPPLHAVTAVQHLQDESAFDLLRIEPERAVVIDKQFVLVRNGDLF